MEGMRHGLRKGAAHVSSDSWLAAGGRGREGGPQRELREPDRSGQAGAVTDSRLEAGPGPGSPGGAADAAGERPLDGFEARRTDFRSSRPVSSRAARRGGCHGSPKRSPGRGTIDWTKSERAFAIGIGLNPSELDRVVAAKESLYLPHRLIARDGGRRPRRIDRPGDQLKRIQRSLKDRIGERVTLPPCLHGSVKGRSPRTNAAEHQAKKVLVKLDVTDFFPSIDEAMVEEIFRRQLHASRQVARAAASLLTRHSEEDPSQTFLPQGSPASSILANLALDRVDRFVQARARRLGVTYTRYVDDIVVSGDRARELIPLVIGLLVHEGFRVSRRKLTVVSRGKSQVVTGVTVNRKLSPPPAFRKTCRELLQEGRTAGPERLEQIIASLRGKCSYARGLEGTFAARLSTRLRLLEIRSEELALASTTEGKERGRGFQ